MSDAFTERPFPRGVLIAVAALLGFTIVTIGIARIMGIKMELAPLAPVVQMREITFVDLDDGSLRVYDAPTGALIETLPPGDEGFIRGVLRSMMRQRAGFKVEATQPYRLERRANGDLSFEDPTTGIRLELRAFGATNEASFQKLLPAPDQGSTTQVSAESLGQSPSQSPTQSQ